MTSHLYCASMKGGLYRATFGGKPLSDFAPLSGVAGNFFLEKHPRLPVLYALDIQGGRVHALAIGDDGGLTPLNDVSSEGAAPCHLAIDAERRKLVVANYNGGVALCSLLPDGSLTPPSSVYLPTGKGADPKRQDRPHPHGVTLRRGVAYIADLGTDRITALRIERDLLTPAPELDAVLAPGSGPRHFVLHPSGRYGLSVNELDNTVTLLSLDPESGALTVGASLPTLPADFSGTSWTAEIGFHPKGELAIATNRGHDSLALFRFDADAARLEAAGIIPSGGAKPQHFVFSPGGDFLFVANSGEGDEGNVTLFQINPASLQPEPIQTVAVPQPMGLWLQ